MALPTLRGAFFILALTGLVACSSENRSTISARAYTPIPQETLSAMASIGSDRNAPILIRAYKKESEIEVWKRTSAGQYALMKTYPVCRWSGQLGPKTREGDRQVPEGFYTVTPGQMNPNSALWLSFNVGYPNVMERSLGRNGGDIMVHGTCSSRGCFAMTNEQMEEIYAVMREAFQGGQKSIQFQAYPFRMTAENLAKFRNDPNMPFWKNLKEGSDRFEVTKREPAVGYCGARYTFGSSDAPSCNETVADPDAAAVAAKARDDDARVASLIASGVGPKRMSYADGDQNIIFRDPAKKKILEKWAAAGEFSRPEALNAVRELTLDHKGNVVAESSETVTAYVAAPKPLIQSITLGAAQPGSSPDNTVDTAKADDSFFTKWFGTSTPVDNTESGFTAPATVPFPPRRG